MVRIGGGDIMSDCWHCYWGWPKSVVEIYHEAEDRLDAFLCTNSVLNFGPSHIVWEDENWEDSSIEFCLDAAVEKRTTLYKEYTDAELAVCEWSLRELLKIPYGRRDYEPDDYDGEHPENYPPPKDVEFVK